MMKPWDRFWTNKKRLRKQEPSQYVNVLVPLFKRRGVKRILDLGCGAGKYSVYLAKLGFIMVGQDTTTIGLKVAQQRLDAEEIRNCVLINHDLTRLPYPGGSFDAVISTNAIHHNRLKDINRAVSEVHRVLRKKGILFINLTTREEIRMGRRLEKGTYMETKGEEKGTIHHIFTRSEINSTFSKFRIIRLTPPTKEDQHWLLLAEKK